MSDLHQMLDGLIENQRKLKLEFQEQARSLFMEITKEFFDKNPGITAIKWTQYTPYFADGDPCVFGVNDPTFTNANEEELEQVSPWGEYEGEDESVWAMESYALCSNSEWYKEDREKVSGVDFESCQFFSKMICSSEMEDVLAVMFDDHVVVTATREGFDVEDYDHD